MDISFKVQAFEGPLDLLLHLIEKNQVDIYDIPIAMITDQYLAYLSEMEKQIYLYLKSKLCPQLGHVLTSSLTSLSHIEHFITILPRLSFL